MAKDNTKKSNEVIFSHYRILRRLGRGGMGRVYLARDRDLDRDVALKFLLPEYLQDPELIARLQREAKAHAAISHPNIVTIYEIASDKGTLAIAMEYVQGTVLKQLIPASGMQMAQALQIAIDICTGLAKAHEANIIHRDINPKNIIIAIDGRTRILDFGIAKTRNVTQLTRESQEGLIGTVFYMAPEQLQGRTADFQADIWAVGITLYEMLTGVLPFQGTSVGSVIRSIIDVEPPPLSHYRPDILPELQNVVTKALAKDPQKRYKNVEYLLVALRRCQRYVRDERSQSETTAAIEHELRHSDTGESWKDSGYDQETTTVSTKRLFLSYKRDSRPDESVALQIYEALNARHEVFIDQNIPIGTHWVERIDEELRQSDYLITLLSPLSIHSEMVKGEIQRACVLGRQNGRPGILPVRLAYKEPFPYPLNVYLQGINWAYWEDEKDTQVVIQELLHAVEGGAIANKKKALRPDKRSTQFPQPSPKAQALEAPEGTMDLESKYYIARIADEVGLEAIKNQGVTITIKAPRQMGKSSLLLQIMNAARKAGKKVAFLDFQLFDQATLHDANIFFKQFCAFLTDELEMEDRVEEHWQAPLGNNQLCTRYVGRYLLKNLGQPLVLAMDEVDTIFDTPFRSDFFGMLRNWHNSRAMNPVWKQMDLALVTSTEPYQLIENLNQSPFNVGEIIELDDFTVEQVEALNALHGSPLNPFELSQLMELLSGQPYLVRKSLYLVAGKRLSAQELFKTATEDRGPFGDHLRYHLFRLFGKDELINGLRQVIEENRCPDERIFFRLRGAGLVKRQGLTVAPRCKLYADYFRENLGVR